MASIELSFIDYPKVTIESKSALLVKIRDVSGTFNTQRKIKKGVVELKVPVLREWVIEAFNGDEKVFSYQLKLEGQVVFINFTNVALGDAIMWPAYLENFRKKYKCKVYLKTRYPELFEKSYPDIIFLKKGQHMKNVDVRVTPQALVDGAPMLDGPPTILNLKKGELRPLIDKPKLKRTIEKSMCA